LPSVTLGADATRYNETTLMRAKVSENFTHARHESDRGASKPLMGMLHQKVAPDLPPKKKNGWHLKERMPDQRGN
jgi:hypothetical protein